MFRLHRAKPAKSGEKVDFKFSHFKALQVPKGWDRLFVSIVSVQTGRTRAKSSKAVVRNGNCQWTETFSESVWISQHESSRELEDCLFKFVVAMGSARSGILGEAIVDMAGYMSSSASVPVSFPLKKCNFGTTLQVKVQCLTPISKLREHESKETNSQEEGLDDAGSPEMEMKSEESDGAFTKNARSSSSRDLGSTTHQEENGREMSFSTSGSHHIYDSAEGSIARDSFSHSNNPNGDQHNLIGGLDSVSSQNTVNPGSYQIDNSSQSDHSFNSCITHSGDISQNEPHTVAASSLKASGTTRSMLEAAEDTIQDLQEEAKKWERDSRKQTLELDVLRKELAEQSKSRAKLHIELSAACAERDGLQKEVERLKVLLQNSMVKSASLENSLFQDEGLTNLVKELESEIGCLKESNATLSLQLNRSQESNAELVALLKELEETLEKQKDEIENLSAAQSKFSDMENSIQVNTEKSSNLILQMQRLKDSETHLQAKVHELEQALEEKSQSMETASLNKQTLSEIETEYKSKLSAKEIEIVSLKAKLSDSMKGKHSAETESTNKSMEDLIREIEELKFKLQELESDCQELTDENLELLIKLKEIKNKNSTGGSFPTSPRNEACDNKSQMQDLEEKIKKKLLKEIENEFKIPIQELESLKLALEVKVEELSEELGKKMIEIERLEAGSQAKAREIENLRRCEEELEVKLSALEKEKSLIEENTEISRREGEIASKCLNDLQKDLKVLSCSMNSHGSTNKTLERKASELESTKSELRDIRQEKEELSKRVSYLEAQVKSLTNEREIAGLELEKSKSGAASLQDEIEKLRNEMESQKMNLSQKLQEVHNQWLEADEEREHLRRVNAELQATSESLAEECCLLQRSNGKLNGEKLELQEHCSQLEEKLRESQRSFAECSNRVQVLEENISLITGESASKEKSLYSKLNVLVKEKEELNKKLDVLNRKYSENMVELQNLELEVGKLTDQLSAARDERDRIASDAAREVTGSHACIVKLESKFNASQIESEAKIQGLADEIAVSRRNQEMLKDDNERLSKLLANYKSYEEKFKTTLSGLELKLAVSDYDRQQLTEESTNMKAQLLKIEPLQEEVATLKNELRTTKSEKQKVERKLQQISEECKELKMEKNSFIEEMATQQKVVSELEDCKRKRNALEEKPQQIEGELMAKEVLNKQDAEIRTELSRIKRTNKQLQKQILQLEDEKHKCSTRVQSLEEELILTKEEQQKQRESNSMHSYSREFDNGHSMYDDNHLGAASKIRYLEDELTKAIEANNLHKVQIKKLMSEGRRSRTGPPRKLTAEGEVVSKEKFERTKSSLETELKDLRERYLHMSLKYAEVEAQREELVMKLKKASMKRVG